MNPLSSAGGDEQHPFETARSERQIAGVLRRLGKPTPRRILDLGCGSGRVLLPLAWAGHAVTGIDSDPEWLAICRTEGEGAVVKPDLRKGDFLEPELWEALPAREWDAVICLGNTWMTIVDVDRAVEVMSRVARLLKPEGVFLLDDFPHEFWPELTEGNWRTGISPDGLLQMVWADDDAVFTLRKDDRVDPESEYLLPDDRLYRLWSSGALTLAAHSSGLSDPARDEAGSLLVMHPERPRNSCA